MYRITKKDINIFILNIYDFVILTISRPAEKALLAPKALLKTDRHTFTRQTTGSYTHNS